MKDHIQPQETVVSMKANEKTVLHLSAKNHKGKTCEVGSVPIWTTTDSALVGLSPSGDGFACEVRGKMKVGKCKVIAEAVGSTGKIATTITFNVLSPYADLLEITVGEVVDL